ncbi:MAG TPA: hypothetical protein PK120_03735 [Syntrophales bacterium]|nr:hypothetical protein [Syntrophales bacterium]
MPRGRDAADRFEQQPVVEPVHPIERLELEAFGVAPRSETTDHFYFVRHHICPK